MPGNSSLKSDDPMVATRAVVSSLKSHVADFERWMKEIEEAPDAARKEMLTGFLRSEVEDWAEFLS